MNILKKMFKKVGCLFVKLKCCIRFDKKNKALRTAYLCFFGFIVLQFVIWFFLTSRIKYEFTITPLPPSKLEMGAFSFGDKELLYRFYGFQLQNAGDTFGETTALQDYDYEKLEQWFYALDELDGRSEYVPSIAGFYYSVSQHAEDNKHIVSYLEHFAERDPVKNWRWYATAAYIAKYKLQDDELAFNIARKLLNIKSDEIPFVHRVISIFLIPPRELKSCKFVRMVAELIMSGDMNSILLDPTFSKKDGKNNYLFKMVKERIDSVIKDTELVNKCAGEVIF